MTSFAAWCDALKDSQSGTMSSLNSRCLMLSAYGRRSRASNQIAIIGACVKRDYSDSLRGWNEEIRAPFCAKDYADNRRGTHTMVGMRWENTVVVCGFRQNKIVMCADETVSSDTGVVHGVHCLTRRRGGGGSVLLWSPAVAKLAVAPSGQG